MFAKDKSVVGNTSAQIFIDGFLHITLMRSKSEDGMSLYRINRDIGVANELFMDNAPEHIV